MSQNQITETLALLKIVEVLLERFGLPSKKEWAILALGLVIFDGIQVIPLLATALHVLARYLKVEVPDHVGKVGGMLGWDAGVFICWLWLHLYKFSSKIFLRNVLNQVKVKT